MRTYHENSFPGMFRSTPTSLVTLLLGALVLVTSSCRQESPEASTPVAKDGAAVFATVCATCHGPQGEGNPELKSPSIASLPDWYVASQVNKFRGDLRGTDPGDTEGIQMRAIAHTIDADSVDAVAAHVASLPRVPTQNTLGGNASAGKETYQLYCEACHRPRASGEFAFKSPPLTGLQDWYLAAQLEKFRQRVRGGHPNDIEGQKMQIPSERFLDEEDEKNVLAYIASLAVVEEE